MDFDKIIDIEYWQKKVEKVCQISKKFGYPEQDREFWENQRAGIISLIIEIYEEVNHE